MDYVVLFRNLGKVDCIIETIDVDFMRDMVSATFHFRTEEDKLKAILLMSS